ncbi:MAG: lysylphosphatidylglycerol synthase transmembrane domain-containing protein, partial [Anaerolineales bacterium]
MNKMKVIYSSIFSSKYLRIALALLVSVLSLYFATRRVDFSQVLSTLSNAKFNYIYLALIFISINHLSKAFRWRLLIQPDGKQLNYWNIFSALMVGQMLNYFFPVRVGDLGRAYVIGGMGPGRSYTLGTVLLEKFLDLIMYVILFLISVLMIPLPTWISRPAFILIVITLLISIVVIIIGFYRNSVKNWVKKFTGRLSERGSVRYLGRQLDIGTSSFEILKNYRILAKLVLWSLAIWISSLMINHVTLRALDLKLPLIASILVLVTLQAGIAIPSVPGRIGVFEFICVATLMFLGVDETLAFSFGILLHALVMFPVVLAGTLLFWVLGLSSERIGYT